MQPNSVSKSELQSERRFFSDFTYGLTTPVRAVTVIFAHPKLIALSGLPILTTVVLLSFAIYAILAGFGSWAHTTFLNHSASLSLIASIVFGLALVFFAINSLTFLSSLVASPFNDWLAESTEHSVQVPNVPTQNLARFIRVFFVDLRKTVLSLALSVLFTLGGLIPVVGIAFLLGLSLLNTFTFVTYPQSRRMHGIRASWKWISQHLAMSLGFGIVTTLMFSIPVANLFALPISVVGGTLLYFRK